MIFRSCKFWRVSIRSCSASFGISFNVRWVILTPCRSSFIVRALLKDVSFSVSNVIDRPDDARDLAGFLFRKAEAAASDVSRVSVFLQDLVGTAQIVFYSILTIHRSDSFMVDVGMVASEDLVRAKPGSSKTYKAPERQHPLVDFPYVDYSSTDRPKKLGEAVQKWMDDYVVLEWKDVPRFVLFRM